MICSRVRCFLVIFCLGCLVAAVQTVPLFSAQAAHKATEITVEQKSLEYTWVLKTPNKPGVVLVSLILSDTGGKAVKQRVITGELWMPKMPMQGYPLELKFDEDEDGQYSALVQYGHGGYWQIRAKFSDDKGQLFEQVFDLDIGH